MDLKEEERAFEVEMRRLKRIQKSVDKQKKKWQKKVESTEWLKILSEKQDLTDRGIM